MTAHLASQIGIRLIDDPNVPGRTVVFCGQTSIGSIYETERANPAMRFKWISADDRYDYCDTVAAAFAAIVERAPGVIAEMEREAARRAEFDAKPAHIQALILAEDKARREFDREENRTVIDEKRCARAEIAWLAAKAELEAATVINPVAEAA